MARLTLCLAALLLAVSGAPVRRHIRHDRQVPEPNSYNMTLRTLLLSTDTGTSDVATTMLTAYGQPYELVTLTSKANGTNALTDPAASFLDRLELNGNPQYNSLVLTSPQLSYEKPDLSWGSALSADQWARLQGYLSKFKIRTVVVSSSYFADPALGAAEDLTNGLADDAELKFVDDEYTRSIVGVVNPGAKFTLGRINPFVKTDYWYYPTKVNTDAPHIKPFMYINPAQECGAANTNTTNSTQDDPTLRVITLTNNVTLPCGRRDWIGAFTRTVDGREEMHFLLNQNVFGHHGFVLADVWLPWATRGVFVGQRRLLLDTQIDDVFLFTGLFNPRLERPALDGDEAGYRLTGLDMELLRRYQDDLNDRLPEGSRFVVQMAYNGMGWDRFGNRSLSQNTATLALRDHFFWLTHTWSHFDLYCPESNCEKNNFTRYPAAYEELWRNKDFGAQVLFADVPADRLDTWPTYSPHSIVTPRISGLNNSESIKAMRDLGISYAVGDNSRKDLLPANPYHALWTPTTDTLNRSMFVIPRYSLRIYFDVSTPDQSAAEFNQVYGPKCRGYNRTEPASWPYLCSQGSFKYDHNLTLAEMLMMEAHDYARTMVQYRWDPYMFHQANLRFTEVDGKMQSLLTMWIDALLAYITSYTTLPIVTYRMDELKDHYMARMQRDGCGLSAHVTYINGLPSNLTVTGNGTCTAKITRTAGVGFMFGDGKEEEAYGLDRTRDIPVAGNSVTAPLTPLATGAEDTTPTLAFLPYPPLQSANTAAMKFNTTDDFKAHVSDSFAQLEQELKVALPQDELEFVPMLETWANGQTCYDHTSEGAARMNTSYLRMSDLQLAKAQAERESIDAWERRVYDATRARAELLSGDVGGLPSNANQSDASTAIKQAADGVISSLKAYSAPMFAAKAKQMSDADRAVQLMAPCAVLENPPAPTPTGPVPVYAAPSPTAPVPAYASGLPANSPVAVPTVGSS